MTPVNNTQHYVPRFLLSAFGMPSRTGKRQQVWCFDKRTGEAFCTAVENVAAEHAFYDVDGSQGVDRAFTSLEDQLSKCHQSIMKAKSISSLSLQEKVGIAFLVASQAMRTRALRNTIREASIVVATATQTAKPEGEPRGGAPLVPEFMGEDDAKLFQLHLMNRGMKLFVRALLQMKWVLLNNCTALPFWCSDDPFTYYNEFPYDRHDGLGFERPGSQTQFPLSRDLCLSIVDPRHFNDYPDEVTVDDTENISFNNHLQVKNSERFIFSCNDDFGLARRMISRKPGLRDPSQGRFDAFDLRRFRH